jgi:hypothetical protein
MEIKQCTLLEKGEELYKEKKKKEIKIIIKENVRLFFVLALIMCFMVWVNTGFRDLRDPYINVYCPKDSFKDCPNPYYEECKIFVVNDLCYNLDPNIYANKFIKIGETIGETPPKTLFMLPTALTVLAFCLSGLCFNKIKKSAGKKNYNKLNEKRK